MEIKIVDAEKIRPLRHSVLRTGFPFSTTLYDRDNNNETIHLAFLEKDKIVTCATLYPEDTKKTKSKNAYRLRGMATDLRFRRMGHGRSLMEESFKRLEEEGCDVLWCNARLAAIDFYESLGFKTKGKMFNIEGIGPHYYMYKKIT